MAEKHDNILRQIRQRFLRMGYKEMKSPTPTYRPDYFAVKIASNGSILEIMLEVEIESALFYEHTTKQLLEMNSYIQHSRKTKKTTGFLVVPKRKACISNAKSLLESLFPNDGKIKVIPVSS